MGKCSEPVVVVDPYTGKPTRQVPKKVWKLNIAKIGLFWSPVGRYFRAKVPDTYPVCG